MSGQVVTFALCETANMPHVGLQCESRGAGRPAAAYVRVGLYLKAPTRRTPHARRRQTLGYRLIRPQVAHLGVVGVRALGGEMGRFSLRLSAQLSCEYGPKLAAPGRSPAGADVQIGVSGVLFPELWRALSLLSSLCRVWCLETPLRVGRRESTGSAV